MKVSSRFSTPFLPLCLLILAAAPAQLAAQTTPYDEATAQTLKEIEDAKKRIAKNPDDAREHYRLGELYEKLSQWQDAVAAYSQAVKIKPDFAYAHYSRGWCYTRLDNYEEALKSHQEAEKHLQITSFKMRLTTEKAHYAIGWDLYRLRRYDEAIARYVKAVQSAPTYQEAAYEIGRVCLARGDQECARQITDKLEPYLRDLLIKEMEIVEWVERDDSPRAPNPLVLKLDKETRPTILHREKAKYTSMAQEHNIQGVVVLGVVFGVNEKITGVRIIRDLPYGLTAQALIALQKIKFKPAMKDGKPVSVRASLEFSFNLY
ncbi:MAG TPA: tetratricopeptide repeat protein [Blastocatellia bacterium]|jgi:tetratricopeptide (TPR) repeat protein|nr:tetratricopeptide repeat protein [Blastocatellia bacterium]